MVSLPLVFPPWLPRCLIPSLSTLPDPCYPTPTCHQASCPSTSHVRPTLYILTYGNRAANHLFKLNFALVSDRHKRVLSRPHVYKIHELITRAILNGQPHLYSHYSHHPVLW